ncbi:alpha/beta-hydrolase [Dentipellis sp. KUC8613]|nr:alpha/beta-hydrolase [Dentipellis sp. KUC8613]
MRLFHFLVLLATPSCIAQTLAPFKVVDLGYATYQSNVHLAEGVTSFLGIRYAAPPVGDLRFAAPQKPSTVHGIQNATAPALQCYQTSIVGTEGASLTSPFRGQSLERRDTDGISNEDCLFLNVHVPDTPVQQSPLPVVVYIHAGGYDAQNSSLFPVQEFVQQSNYSLISVNIQYRLGVFGFLGGQAVKDKGALNAGLLDQQLALEWVQEFISKFGGDPTKVAIWGESAGAGSVVLHTVAHGGNTDPPLFRAALANSPFLPFAYQYNDPITESLYSNIVVEANCTESVNALGCLRKVDANALATAEMSVDSSNFLGLFSFVPVVDGEFLVETPTVTLQRGRINGEAALFSTNTHEGTLFAPPEAVSNITLTQYVTGLFPRLNQQQIDSAVQLYQQGDLDTVPDQAAAVIGDVIFICPAYYALEAFGERGWKAEFAIPPGLHGDDVSYQFSTFFVPRTFNNTIFSTGWQQAFINMARSLDPNAKSEDTIVPQWPSWCSGGTEMLFNRTDVDLGYASYQSNVNLVEGVTSFLGVRYAAPPVGKFRFAAPQTPNPVRGVQNATKAPLHRSLEKRDTDGISNEDCLFLNVHVPNTPSQQSPLPVIVYIHGGGYDAGNGTYYPAQDFVKESNYSVISINVQYRLGLFGFLGGQAVKNNGSLNAGMLDQQFALKWVQTYISKFGGDPTKVSIWGESAGAGSIILHSVAHGGNVKPPLFRAGLANSPFLPFLYNYSDPITESLYSQVVSKANCTNSTDTLGCLRKVNATALAAAEVSIDSANFLGLFTFVPVIDGDFLVERPTVTLQRGKLNSKAVLISTNTHEGTIFSPPQVVASSNITLRQYISGLFPRLDEDQIRNAVRLYQVQDLPTVPDQASAVMGDSIFICPGYYTLKAFGENAWKAKYAIPPGLHGDDLSYEFSTFATPPAFNNTAFIKGWQQAFLNMARSLDPNTKTETTITVPSRSQWCIQSLQVVFRRLVAASSAHADSSFKVVDLGYATYQTNVNLIEGVTSFLGIRYAAPPVGKFRFAAPRAPSTVQGVQNATKPALQCFQDNIFGTQGASLKSPFRSRSLGKRDTDGISDEDCLFLNVHVPSKPSQQGPLPVIVYIHGGGYDAGNSTFFTAQDFVQESKGSIISVNFQYRLGLFGFLGGQAVKNNGSLNAGLLDQEFALQWVQKHISKFGGDPTKVTIWGESAGAGSVLLHTVAHAGKTKGSLFRAGIANSPFLPFVYNYSDPITEALYSQVVSSANCTDSADTLDCLRGANASLLTSAEVPIDKANFLGTFTFVPVLDDDFLLERPTVTLQRGRLNTKIGVITTNTHEGTFFAPPEVIANTTLHQYISQLLPRLSETHIKTAVQLYQKKDLTTPQDQAAAVMGDTIFVCPAYYMLKAFGKRAWKAKFAIEPAFHGEDNSYEFST